MKLSNRRLWIGAIIAIGVMILLTFLAAPNNNKRNSGSTFYRAPDGYGAWFAYMEEQGTPLQRWQKSFQDLLENPPQTEHSMTFLQVHSDLVGQGLDQQEQDWIYQGNTLVVLGVRSPVSAAEFSTLQSSPVGNVKVDTGRRYPDLEPGEKTLLGDRFGAVVWQKQIGNGQAIFATTPYLAANAYQDQTANFKFLAQLVTQDGNAVWVDEYLHGYKDAEAIAREGSARDWVSYLAATPVFPALLQAGILLLVLIWSQNRRFGPSITLAAPVVDNSEAYIQALAGVLHKAGSSEFVLDVVGKEEQLQVQKALGLGPTLLEDRQALIAAWVQQTGRPASELEQVLQVSDRKRRISQENLLTWLGKIQVIRRHLS